MPHRTLPRQLKVGGIAVGPFEDGEGEQTLMRATKLADDEPPPATSTSVFFCGATRCKLERLMSVSFAPLVSTRSLDTHERAPPDSDGAAVDDSPRLVLRAPRWGDAPPFIFSAGFAASQGSSSIAASLRFNVGFAASNESSRSWSTWSEPASA